MGSDRQLGEDSTSGDMKLPMARVCLAFRNGSTTMGDENYAPAFNMSELWNGLQRFDRHD